ncbi:MAG TPA: right-handed parallel beta-helix repeat-containing protein [Luteolibacter sp.]
MIAVTLVLLALAGGGYWKWDQDRQREIREEVSALRDEGLIRLHDHEWLRAREVFRKIEALQPGSEDAAKGVREVEEALAREKQEFVARRLWLAGKAFDAMRWEEAEAAVKEISDTYPGETAAAEMAEKIIVARRQEEILRGLSISEAKLRARDWNGALAAVDAVLALDGGHAAAKALRGEIEAAKALAEADRAKARGLFAQAKAADQGKYDKQLADWLKDAAALAPDDAEIAALLAKVSTYTRTLKIPGDFATPAEAMAVLQDQDVLVIAAGTWQGPLVIDKKVEIRGAGAAETIVECPATENCAISFGPGAKGTKVSGITFRHQAMDSGAERYSAALVRGGEVTFDGCQFTEAAGHGLMVVEGGKVVATRCALVRNGWDGAAASGEGSSLVVRDSTANANYEHGLDVWNGASAVFEGNRCTGNGRNGILIDTTAMTEVASNELHGNHEFGLVLATTTNGRATGNRIEANQLGGLVVRAKAVSALVAKNLLTGQSAPALVLETGVPVAGYRNGNELPSDAAAIQTVDFNAPESAAPASP